MMRQRTYTGVAWFAFIAALISLACVVVPLLIIQPFRHQAPRELHFALFVIQIGPWLSAACAAVCLAALVLIWRRTSTRFARFASIALVLFAAAGAYLTHVNIYEHMFHPIGLAQFEAAERAHIDSDDMVIAVNVNGHARAYPIREMAYHHVVNDNVAGVPIVATY